MLATAIAAAVGSGLAIRHLANQDEKHVLPSSSFTLDPRVPEATAERLEDHPVLSTCPSFRNKDGLIIRTRSWMPEGEEPPKAILFLVHGFAEHCGRYLHVVEEILKLGVAVYALDHQGHGKSEGERAYVCKFDDFVDDLLQFIHSVSLAPGQKRFLLGHSMGGLISVLTASREPELFEAVVLSSPWLMLDEETMKKAPLILPAARFVSTYLPKLVIAPGLPANYVCKDPAIVANYLNDPLNCSAVGIRARTIVEAERVQSLLRNDGYSKMSMPMLVMQAAVDKLVNPQGAKDLFNGAPSKDKELKMFENFEHEIFNEPDKNEDGENPPLALMRTWIKSRL